MWGLCSTKKAWAYKIAKRFYRTKGGSLIRVRLYGKSIQGPVSKGMHLTTVSLHFTAAGDVQRNAFNFYDQGKYKGQEI